MSGSSVVPLLIACGFRASFPMGIAWVVTRLLSRSSAATRHFTWACAIGIAALLPIMTVAMPHWSVSTPAPLTRLASPAHVGHVFADVVDRDPEAKGKDSGPTGTEGEEAEAEAA